MNELLRRAESILDVASVPGANRGETAILVDRGGQLRVMSREGWTLSGLVREFGASEVYMVNKRAGTVTVEGWSATNSCTISRKQAGNALADLSPMTAAGCYSARSQVTPQLAT